MAASERLPLVLRLLADPAPRIRAATLGAIEPESLVNAAEIALRLLGDADLSVQAAAIDWAAPKLVSAKETEVSAAFEAAVTRALASREADFQVSAVDALSRLGDAGKGRLEVLTSHPEPAVRQRALERLAEKWGREAAKGRSLPVETARTGADYLRMARRALGPAPRVAVATDAGEFEMTFDAVRAPLTVDALLGLIEAKFFDGLLFHRVVPDFVVQGGDPRGDGTGGPGFSIRDELSPVEYRRGTAGIALSGPDTGGSQWFVTLSRQPHLDGNYATFGQVTSGLEVLDDIQQGMKIRAMKVLETP
jgi:cyclophilin family peptidyl-prolyl cis-trans isomerase